MWSKLWVRSESNISVRRWATKGRKIMSTAQSQCRVACESDQKKVSPPIFMYLRTKIANLAPINAACNSNLGIGGCFSGGKKPSQVVRSTVVSRYAKCSQTYSWALIGFFMRRMQRGIRSFDSACRPSFHASQVVRSSLHPNRRTVSTSLLSELLQIRRLATISPMDWKQKKLRLIHFA